MNGSELLEVTLIDVDPVNSVVSSPDGRVFVDMSKMLTDATIQLAMEAITIPPTDVEGRAMVAGKARILKTLLNAQEGLIAVVRLQKRGEEITKQNIEAEVERDRARVEKEFEARTGKPASEANPLDFL